MFSTRDVSLAAFIRFKGHQLKEYATSNRGKDGEWTFEVDDNVIKSLKIEYVNSDIAAFEGIRRGMAKQKYG
jgi:hypothetical protein